jgi:hypothetical protein
VHFFKVLSNLEAHQKEMDVKDEIRDRRPFAKLPYEKIEGKHFSGCSKQEFRIRPLSSLKQNQFYCTVPVQRVLRRIFWHKKDKETVEWRKLHNEELNDLYCSSSIVRVIKSRKM